VQLFEIALVFALVLAGNQKGVVNNIKLIFLCRSVLLLPKLKWLAVARNSILLRSSLLISDLMQ
jgi:hypothetical protein